MNRYHFDLRTEPWIPVRTLDGTRVSLGIRQVIQDAHKLAWMEFPNPLTNIGIFRVLLAAIHSMENGPRSRDEWLSIYSRGRFEARKVSEYFEKWSDRFDLFHEQYPFLQTAGLENQDKKGNPRPQSVALLQHEIASGHRKTLFDHNTDNRGIELSAAKTASALVTLQFFALSGLAKKTSNLFGYQQSYYMAPLVAGIPTLLVGDNLCETLLFNLLTRQANVPIPSANPAGDIPVWEREQDLRVHPRSPAPDGYLDYLVPKSRHIRLIPQGQKDYPVVRSLHVAQGVAFPNVKEPMFYRRFSQTDRESLYAPQLKPDRSLWRDSSALFGFSTFEAGRDDFRPWAMRQFGEMAFVGPEKLRHRILCCKSHALANNKANPLMWRVERLQFPDSLLYKEDLVSRLLGGLKEAESVGGATLGAAKRYFEIALGNKPPPKEVSAAVDSSGIRRGYWGLLDGPFRFFLAGIKDTEAAEQWRNNLQRAARSALSECVLSRSGMRSSFYRAAVESRRFLEAGLRRILKSHEEEAA